MTRSLTRLGCPVGTVESRLSRARERLRARLVRRGLAPTASALGASRFRPPGASAVIFPHWSRRRSGRRRSAPRAGAWSGREY